MTARVLLTLALAGALPAAAPLPGVQAPGSMEVVRGFRVVSDGEVTRIVIETSGVVRYRDDYQPLPPRLTIEILGARLIVVLGHQSCGAVDAAMKTVAANGKAPGHIQSLVTAIKPVVTSTPKADLETMTKANVTHVVNALRSSNPILKSRVDSGEVQVIGGYYTLNTGAVTFLDRAGTAE